MSLLYVSLTLTSLLSYSHFSVIRLFLYPHVSSHIHMSLLYVSFHIHMSLLYVSFCIHMSHLHVSFLFYLITHDAPSLLYVSLPFICLFDIHMSLSYSYVSVLLHPYVWHSCVSLLYEFLSHHPAHRGVLNLSHMFTKRDVECWRKETYMKCA